MDFKSLVKIDLRLRNKTSNPLKMQTIYTNIISTHTHTHKKKTLIPPK